MGQIMPREILVIEDERSIRRLFGELDIPDIKFILTANPDEANEVLRQRLAEGKLPDAVFADVFIASPQDRLDLNSDTINWAEDLSIEGSPFNKIPIIFTSATTDRPLMEKIKSLPNYAGFIEKPSDIVEIEGACDAILKSHPPITR